ncbi:MAG: glutathione S-transferase N-terminal domain-containing protein [Saccharospirillaceae bacterium]|nr:glutathione S-transferase N-terminal domain-containing protein [Pseudomonadales bacterium]NRB77106.1 glutathione S-transferase N-terminal domain-containing protein [Saccharospirillaceae bacterium]
MFKSRTNLAGHQLYYFTTCSFCLFVRVKMWWFGIKMPLKEIMFNAQNKVDLIEGGGKSQVPCLRIENENGTVFWMYESKDIIEYLKSKRAK